MEVNNMQVEEQNLMSRKLKTCENCEWCIPKNDFPNCLLSGNQVGLFETCGIWKERTGNHISM